MRALLAKVNLGHKSDWIVCISVETYWNLCWLACFHFLSCLCKKKSLATDDSWVGFERFELGVLYGWEGTLSKQHKLNTSPCILTRLGHKKFKSTHEKKQLKIKFRWLINRQQQIEKFYEMCGSGKKKVTDIFLSIQPQSILVSSFLPPFIQKYDHREKSDKQENCKEESGSGQRNSTDKKWIWQEKKNQKKKRKTRWLIITTKIEIAIHMAEIEVIFYERKNPKDAWQMIRKFDSRWQTDHPHVSWKTDFWRNVNGQWEKGGWRGRARGLGRLY